MSEINVKCVANSVAAKIMSLTALYINYQLINYVQGQEIDKYYYLELSIHRPLADISVESHDGSFSLLTIIIL